MRSSNIDYMELLLQHIHQETGVLEFIEKSSSKYQLTEDSVQKFSDILLSSILSAIIVQGDTPETEALLSNYNKSLSDSSISESEKINLTITLLNKIFNNNLDNFFSLLSVDNQIALNNVKEMSTHLSELFINQMFKFMITENYSISGLLGHLLGERDYYIDHMPDDIIKFLNISSKHNLGQNISADAVVVSNAVRYTLLREEREKEEATKKKSWFEKIFKKDR